MLVHGSALPRRALDRADDFQIGAAAADIAVHMRDDLGPRRILVVREQLGRLHDMAGLAIAALRHLLGDPGFLQRMAAVGRKSLDGGDRLALDQRDRHGAGAHRLPIDVHRAGPAGGDAAAELGAGHLEVLAQHPQQRGIAVYAYFLALAIDRESNHLAPPWLEVIACVAESYPKTAGCAHTNAGIFISRVGPVEWAKSPRIVERLRPPCRRFCPRSKDSAARDSVGFARAQPTLQNSQAFGQESQEPRRQEA